MRPLVGRPREGLSRRIWSRILSLLLIPVGALVTVGAPPASAATVDEIDGCWEANTPGTVARGDVVTAIWRVHVQMGAGPAGRAK